MTVLTKYIIESEVEVEVQSWSWSTKLKLSKTKLGFDQIEIKACLTLLAPKCTNTCSIDDVVDDAVLLSIISIE